MGRYDTIIESVKEIDVDSVKKWEETNNLKSKTIESQRVYIWIRLYLKEELEDIKAGDDIVIKYIPSEESLETKFICFGKTTLSKDHLDEITNFNPEDDKKILCLMVDQDVINKSNEIPFIRTLFKSGYHYQYQLVKRTDLTFTNKRTDNIIEYYDCDY